MLLLHIDHRDLEDLLFVPSLARALATPDRRRPPCVVVHGSGEQAERLLEAEGLFPERHGGVLAVDSPGARALLERAVREQNQRMVAALADASVPAVGVLGTDRGLLRYAADGTIHGGRVGWLRTLTRQSVVPVVAALVADATDGAREAPVTAVVGALAKAMENDGVAVVFFSRVNRPGIFIDGALAEQATPEQVAAAAAVHAPDQVRQLVAQGVAVYVTTPAGLMAESGVRATQVIVS